MSDVSVADWIAPRLRGFGGRVHQVVPDGFAAYARRMGHQVTDDWFDPQSPSLLWPVDRSWCLATEIDFDSTLIGGPRELIDALLQQPDLEAWPVTATDDLSVDGDLVNG